MAEIWSVGLSQLECLILAVFVSSTVTMGTAWFELVDVCGRVLEKSTAVVKYKYICINMFFSECFVSQ